MCKTHLVGFSALVVVAAPMPATAGQFDGDISVIGFLKLASLVGSQFLLISVGACTVAGIHLTRLRLEHARFRVWANVTGGVIGAVAGVLAFYAALGMLMLFYQWT